LQMGVIKALSTNLFSNFEKSERFIADYKQIDIVVYLLKREV
jgi:hypothetical protein